MDKVSWLSGAGLDGRFGRISQAVNYRSGSRYSQGQRTPPDGPDLLRLQRTLGTNHPAHARRTPLFGRRLGAKRV
jgi:hypothetical protein